jgi:hypothetical protein
MAKCWLLLFENCAGVKGHGYLSADTVGTAPGSCGVVLIINGANTGIGERSAQWFDVSTTGHEIPPEYGTNYGNSCTPAPTPIKHDCINGACLPKATYNTPGIYNSLSECQTACGTGCSGQCISNSDWAQIEGLADKLKQKNCS